MLHSVAGRATIAGTNLRAIASLFGTATYGARVREISVTNTTATAVTLALVEFTSATGVGAGLTEINEDINPTQCTAFAGHTADGAGISAAFRQITLPGAIGATFIWTFSEGGFTIPVGAANGIGIIVPTGAGQVCDFSFKWEE